MDDESPRGGETRLVGEAIVGHCRRDEKDVRICPAEGPGSHGGFSLSVSG